jgi:prevent-host-death family protein
MKATELRAQLYRVLDRVAETGEPVEIVRKGRKLRISVEEEAPVVFKAANLVAHPGAVVGDPDALVQLDWTAEWRPFEDRTDG